MASPWPVKWDNFYPVGSSVTFIQYKNKIFRSKYKITPRDVSQSSTFHFNIDGTQIFKSYMKHRSV
jgi:hypothetical protein